MNILFAGAGAMGARFGALLHEKGNNVLFADAWKEHRDVINRDGLKMIIDGEDLGYFKIPAVAPTEVTGDFDVIFVFTKAMQLDQMLQDIKPVIKDNTKVICLLNGLGHIEVMERYIKPENIYIGVTVWSSGLGGPGIVDASGRGTIEIKQIKETNDHDELLRVLNEAGLGVTYSDDVLVSIWNKVALNAVLNSYCTLIDCNINQFGTYKDQKILVDGVVREVIEVGKAENIILDYDDVVRRIEGVYPLDKAGAHHPSLYQDMANNRPTEIDYLNGAIARIGAKHGIPTPINTMLTHMIHSKEHAKGII